VDINGNQDPESLIPQGWQRAGALAAFFDPVDGMLQNPGSPFPCIFTHLASVSIAIAFARRRRLPRCPKNSASRSTANTRKGTKPT